MTVRRALVMIVALWLAAVLQTGLAPWMAWQTATPDFPLVVMVVVSLFLSRPGSTVAGFLAGVVSGAVVGVSLGAFAFSRLVTGFLLGTVRRAEFDSNGFVAGFLAAAATVPANVILYFLAPIGSVGSLLASTAISAMWNALWAVPTFWLLRPLLDEPKR
jgi:cell shape-determining protein MreD